MFTIWYSTEIFADYIIENTILNKYSSQLEKRKIMESDANNAKNFHRMPDHIKNILYLDAPDLIVELEGEPIFTIEISREAGTGHNAFQRFLRLLASVENGVPAIYIYPEGVQVGRGESNKTYKWDKINPIIFKALEKMMRIHNEPALLFYHPSLLDDDSKVHKNKGLLEDDNYPSCPLSTDSEMMTMFGIIDDILKTTTKRTKQNNLINLRSIQNRRDWMIREYNKKNPRDNPYSPITATKTVCTSKVLNYLKQYGYDVSNESLLSKRAETVIYCMDAKFRGDPYPGALGALDYIMCRTGKTFEDRDKNLVICWGTIYESDSSIHVNSTKSSISDYIKKIKTVYSNTRPYKCLLGKEYEQLVTNKEVPRYYMQTRYGCTYTKVKEIRGYSYFADVILFVDGALWREA